VLARRWMDLAKEHLDEVFPQDQIHYFQNVGGGEEDEYVFPRQPAR
jgi:hypothetical protein